MSYQKSCSPEGVTLASTRQKRLPDGAQFLSTSNYTTPMRSVNAQKHAQDLARAQHAQDPDEPGTIDAQDALQRDLQALAEHAARRAAYHRGLADKHARIAAALRAVVAQEVLE